MKVEAQVTLSVPLIASFPPTVTSQEVVIVVALTPFKVEAHSTAKVPLEANVEEAWIFVALISVQVSVVIFQVQAVIVEVFVVPTIVASPPTLAFPATAKLSLKLVAQVTSRVHPTVAFPLAESVSVEVEVAVTSPAVKVVMLASVKLAVSAVIACHVNVPSAVMFPVKVTSPFTVERVTFDKSKFIPSIAFSKAAASSETL